MKKFMWCMAAACTGVSICSVMLPAWADSAPASQASVAAPAAATVAPAMPADCASILVAPDPGTIRRNYLPDLLRQGEFLNSKARQAKCVYDKAVEAMQTRRMQEQESLRDAGNQLVVDQDDVKRLGENLEHEGDAYQAACAAAKAASAACQKQKQQLDADTAAYGNRSAEVQREQADIDARTAQQQAKTHPVPTEVSTAFGDLIPVLKADGAWLDQVRGIMSSSGFKSYGEAAGCPDVTQPTRTPDRMFDMADEVIACLHRVAAAH